MSSFKLITKTNITKLDTDKRNLILSIEKNLISYEELLNQLPIIFDDYKISIDNKQIFLKKDKREPITIYIIKK